jgi:AraC-like DNA-binding protein
MARNSTVNNSAERSAIECIPLARAASYIERNLTSQDLTPASVAEAAHVSRSTLYRLFSPSGGVKRYILNARLDRAWSALADPKQARRVSDVAFDTGFLSDAHFCRAFRRAFGVTPGRVKRSWRKPPLSESVSGRAA